MSVCQKIENDIQITTTDTITQKEQSAAIALNLTCSECTLQQNNFLSYS